MTLTLSLAPSQVVRLMLGTHDFSLKSTETLLVSLEVGYTVLQANMDTPHKYSHLEAVKSSKIDPFHANG